MSSPRADFAAVALPSGKVLLIGGQTSPATDTDSVDLFDPATNSITAAAAMGTPRNGQTATLLPNGKVLVAGGSSAPGGAALASAEIYDPTTNSWSPAAAMAQPREHHAAVLTQTGKVFVAGGETGSGGPDPTGYELYDAGTNTWTAARALYGDRPHGLVVISLGDGRVLVYGGVQQVEPGNSQEVYDPSTGQTSPGYLVDSPDRSFATGALLDDGSVLIAGGQQTSAATGALNTTDIYEVRSSLGWAYGPPMSVGHCHHTMTTLRNHLILVAGGRCGASESIAVAELYDQVGKQWWSAGSMQDPRGFHVAVLLADGRVLVAGGIFPGGTIAAMTEIYTPA